MAEQEGKLQALAAEHENARAQEVHSFVILTSRYLTSCYHQLAAAKTAQEQEREQAEAHIQEQKGLLARIQQTSATQIEHAQRMIESQTQAKNAIISELETEKQKVPR